MKSATLEVLEFEIFGDPDHVPDDWDAVVDEEDEGFSEP